MDVLLVCKPSGRNAMSFFLTFAAFTALSVIWVYQGFEDHGLWWYLLLTVPVSVFTFFGFRYEFVGEEHLGVEGTEFVRVLHKFPFHRDVRIPLSDIVEVGYNRKNKLEEIAEDVSELQGRAIDEDAIVLVTKAGKKYHFGQDLTEKQVERFRERLYEYMMSMGIDVNFSDLND